MSSVAEQLRSAREAQKLTVYQVAEATKIKTEHVRALDDGNFNVFSAPVFIRGFVRTYATFVKLDVPGIMKDLDAELSRSTKFSEPPPLTEKAGGPIDFLMFQLSRINWRIALPVLGLAVIILIAVMGYRAWHRHQNADPLSDLGPGLYQPANSPGETLSIPPTK